MGLPVTVYRWDDAGAPQLSTNPTPTEIIAVIKACLVTGYGAKAGLGWSVAFENVGTNKVAFRNSTFEGSGGYVQFWSTDGSNTAGKPLYIRAASAMSSLDNFIHPSSRFLHYNSSANNQWVIIGTSASVYIIPKISVINTNYLSSGYNEVSYFIGDLDSNYANDVTRFTICACNFSGEMTGVNYSNSLSYGGSSACGIMYGVDGNVKSNTHSINFGDVSVQQVNSNYTLEEQSINPVLTPVHILMTTKSSTDIDGLSCVFSNKNPWYRGLVPGLYGMQFCGYGSQEWPLERTWNGATYLLLRGYFNGTWLNITEWY
ncbi:hypothetical protein [Shewanella frigidimarina]|uniref:hypothetical protein n=1 Tax=Shewanella frigidimarina TaxID=56812 RepID=UPI003D79E8DD